MNCLICNQKVDQFFSDKILGKYSCQYYQCSHCGFIQTEPPYWLDEAYSNAIADLDIGILGRNLHYSSVLERLLLNYFDYRKPCLDYAGGYGILVRMMRDKGFDYYRQDKYCQNLFAVHFDIKDISIARFELLSALEVFEHLTNPIEELKHMLTMSDSILFSTELIPHKKIKKATDWWYFAPEGGQHIAFYTLESLRIMATLVNCFLYSNGRDTHLITRKKFRKNPFYISPWNIKYKIIPLFDRVFTRYYYISKGVHLHSKVNDDYCFIKSMIDERPV